MFPIARTDDDDMPFPSLPSPPTLFPTYLVPSLPFRRRQSSTDSNVSNLSDASSSSDATISSSSPSDDSYLSGHASNLRCSRCLSDLALSSQIISKGFTGRHGRAYLVAPSSSAISTGIIETNMATTAKARNDALPNLPNTYTHKPVPRQLVTGAHTVGDISCAQCGSVLGWKYVAAEDRNQKYKIGKFILETKRVCRSSQWENADHIDEEGMVNENRRGSITARRRSSVAPPSSLTTALEGDDIEFDSQDEEECDALFAGTWTPASAKEHRAKKTLKRLDE